MKTVIASTLLFVPVAGAATAVVPGANMDCSYPVTDSERALCARQGWDRAAEDLFETIGAVRALLLNRSRAPTPETREALMDFEAEQKRWFIESREACEGYASGHPADELAYTLSKYGCLATVTRERIEHLKEFVENTEN